MTIAAMKQALEALDRLETEGCSTRATYLLCSAAITALRAAIEQAEKAEPVAWITGGDCYADGHIDCYAWTTGEFTTPLYTHPAPVPAGWQLVPVEPTKAMLSAGWGNDHLYADLYKAMLQAAPKPGEMK